MVGAAGFEPTTLCPPDKCATRLRYAPTRGMPYPRGAFDASGDFACSGGEAICRARLAWPADHPYEARNAGGDEDAR